MRCFTLILLLPLLTSCTGDSVDAPFQQYLQRLGRTLDIATVPPAPDISVPRLARPGQLRVDIVSDKLGTLDFLDLRGCALQTTVGKSNSSLGRMARDSQRLLLALEFMRLAPDCITLLQSDGEQALAATLARALENKRRQLPALVFNATLGGEEFAALWRPGRLQAQYPENTSSTVITALEGITVSAQRWLAGDYRADNMDLELQLSAVARGDGGQLWKALAHQGRWLQRANAALELRLQRGPLCPPDRRPQAADILPNVIGKFFIEGIQPRAAALGRRYHQLLPPVVELETLLLAALPPAYRQWQQLREQDLARLSRQPREHVDTLQHLLSSCQSPRNGTL
ncbi:DUF3080 family protein [Seongchinamella unica]|uniref:DUF3080 family protein n=1 Tax=Seongchinamella unica TaxID=2547392 RepID=A0A4R5LX05_9GAMM|nr:DUF3080 family protein [Seongchinamella unica]TDG16034.1 DUF3080 family protein [Seongchinamella unica]